MDARALIVQGMKKSLYEIEMEARRMRAEEVARLLRAGADAVVSFCKSVLRTKVVRHA
jgi:hypothetical protein